MWNFSTTGFVSAVEYSPRATWDKKTKKLVTTDKFATQLPADYIPADPKKGQRSSHLLVRARVEADLDALKTYDPEAIVFEDKTADYTFRVIVRRTAFAQFMYDTAMGIDYWSHVKETINARAPKVQGGRMGALMQVWTACSRWQPVRPYGGSWAPAPLPVKKSSGSVVHFPKGQARPSQRWDDGADSLTGSGDLFADCPLEVWEEDLMAGRISRKTMEGQVAEILDGEGSAGDVADVTDRIEDQYGTVDVDDVDFNDVWRAVEASNGGN